MTLLDGDLMCREYCTFCGVSKLSARSYGLMFVGRRFSEETLLGLAFAFEQATGVGKYRQPYIRPTADLLSNRIGTALQLFDQVEGYLEGEDSQDESNPFPVSEMVSVLG